MRLSGLQKEVLALYRHCLRESRKKPEVSAVPLTTTPTALNHIFKPLRGQNLQRVEILTSETLQPLSFYCAKENVSFKYTPLKESRTFDSRAPALAMSALVPWLGQLLPSAAVAAFPPTPRFPVTMAAVLSSLQNLH
ncbi:hypothetical protein MY11210_002416 [Beauveria gryllotalpidicola]